jgi:hypothetical protein
MEKKIYLANLKSFGNYGSIKGRLYLPKTQGYWETDDKGVKYLPIIINVNKGPDKYGNTHSVILDTWKPDASKATTQLSDKTFVKTKDGLPF